MSELLSVDQSRGLPVSQLALCSSCEQPLVPTHPTVRQTVTAIKLVYLATGTIFSAQVHFLVTVKDFTSLSETYGQNAIYCYLLQMPTALYDMRIKYQFVPADLLDTIICSTTKDDSQHLGLLLSKQMRFDS